MQWISCHYCKITRGCTEAINLGGAFTTCSGRVAASLLFCSLQWLSFKACFILLQGGWRLPGNSSQDCSSPTPVCIPSLLLRLRKPAQVLWLCLKGAVEAGGWKACWFSLPSEMALHYLRVQRWQVLLDFSSSQRSWRQTGFNNRDSQVTPKPQAPAGLEHHFCRWYLHSTGATLWEGGLKSSC